MSEAQAPEVQVLFSEPGASWLWLLAGPAAGIAMLLIQISSGYGPKPLVPGIFLVLVTGFLAIQVKAARIHTSVVLTPEYLREGAETILVPEIVRVYPEAEGNEVPKWQSARALGELTGVPRGRTGIGVRLTSDRTAQAWARRHRELRAALNSVVDGTTP
ncbi:MAG: hypothetical protein QOH54_1325 [Mycobacterium sp.]|nr:hypothetical protein [Mycobacterium sp.]MDT5286672.1 hypothetical protein [Mycobacterium sp.]